MNDDELRDLQERVAVVTDMTESVGWAMLVDAATAAIASKQLNILRGNCSSYEEYKSECSFSHGMDYLLKLPTRLQETLKRELELRQESADDLEGVI